MKARQAGIRSQRGEGYVRIAVRAEAFDGAAQNIGRQPAQGRLERGWRAGVRSQDARGQQVRQLMPEQRIQGPIAFHGIGRAQEQSGCNEIGMRRSLQEFGWCGCSGFAGNARISGW